MWVTIVTIHQLLVIDFCTSKTINMKDDYNNAIVVDARTPEEYAGEHFPKVINIPLD